MTAKAWASIAKKRIRIGPSGIISTKSTMCTNCTVVKKAIR